MGTPGRLRVIRVYKSLKRGGGVHTRLMELLPRLAEQVDLRVLCYRERGGRAAELEDLGIPVDLVPMGTKWAPGNVGRYTRYFSTHAPDVVHTHEYTANTVAIVAARRASVPVRVRHLHTVAPWGTGGPVRIGLRRIADARAARQADLTLAVSETVRRHYLAHTNLPPASCEVLYNGVDLGRFEGCGRARFEVRERWGIDRGAPVVGTLGRLTRHKGHEEFLEVAARIARRRPDVRFVIVGEGGNRGPLEARIEELDLNPRVALPGHSDDVPESLGGMDLFLFPSPTEGLPGAVIEAQAAGLPVIGRRLPFMAEVVRDGVTGTLVSGGDAAGLADACLEYLEDAGRAEAARRAAVENARRFSLDACVGRTLALYERLRAQSR